MVASGLVLAVRAGAGCIPLSTIPCLVDAEVDKGMIRRILPGLGMILSGPEADRRLAEALVDAARAVDLVGLGEI
jgi:hypothetical protein